jgi:hypothetical protein
MNAPIDIRTRRPVLTDAAGRRPWIGDPAAGLREWAEHRAAFEETFDLQGLMGRARRSWTQEGLDRLLTSLGIR